MGRAGVSGTATGVDRSELEVMAGAWLCHPPTPAMPPGMSWWHWGCDPSARAAAGINQQGKVLLCCTLMS